MAIAPSTPAPAARLVVRAMSPMLWPTAAIVEPGLKPHQPTQRMMTPRTASGMLWPEMVCGFPASDLSYVADALANGGHRRAGVEAPPANPEDDDAEDRERHVVAGDGLRVSGVVVLADTGAEQERARQRRHSTGEGDDRRR